MQTHLIADSSTKRLSRCGFSLVEMLVVIAIMSILMTAGAIGLNSLNGKGVTAGVSTAEAVFAEARTLAVSRGVNVRVLIAKDLTNNPQENLRRMLIVSERLDDTGRPIKGNWEINNRGVLLPDKVFFSQDYSRKDVSDGTGGVGSIEEVPSLPDVKPAFLGSYFYYEFNSEGICVTPSTSFVIASGIRSPSTPTAKPRVSVSSGLKDFGGFVVWRNGSTSIYRSPDQISNNIKTIASGSEF